MSGRYFARLSVDLVVGVVLEPVAGLWLDAVLDRVERSRVGLLVGLVLNRESKEWLGFRDFFFVMIILVDSRIKFSLIIVLGKYIR